MFFFWGGEGCHFQWVKINPPNQPSLPRFEAMTKVEATQLKAAARHLKSVSSRKEADKMVAKVPAPLDWAGGIRFGGEFKRMKRMNESDFPKRKA